MTIPHTTLIVTHKGQITIPKAIRQQLGIQPGSHIDFAVTTDQCIELKILKSSENTITPGYGLLKSTRPSVPADFDPALLLDSTKSSE